MSSKKSGREPHISLEYIGIQTSLKIDRSSKWLGRSPFHRLDVDLKAPRLNLKVVKNCSDLHFVAGMKEEEQRTDALHTIGRLFCCMYIDYIILVDWK